MKAKNARSVATRVALMEAALQVIIDSGVKGVTHRKVCSAANLALGSVNYHYDDLDGLLLDAFAYHVDRISEQYESAFSLVRGDEDLADAVVAMTRKLAEDTNSVVLMWEMYAQGARENAYRQLIRTWSKRAKSGVEMYCSPRIATILEAIWDGHAVQRNVGDGSLSEEELRDVVLRIIRSDETRAYPRTGDRAAGAS
ncbi:TetR/AcrR family transcriptional regulator [Gordonia paraffinivorans]|uniref:TetR/AcrR family transcriptional regulator n=1 Tax=Gordonia paraffinivorans TaxID=175628 RepID=UPI001446F05A|nr:TetR family transcriptional regulator [Gordonia paraffinivorans]